jgi:hypothetical protein
VDCEGLEQQPTSELLNFIYLVPLRLVTKTFKGVAEEPDIPPPVGVAVAVRVSGPLREGFQLQTATMFGDEPEVRTLMHPGIRTLFTLNKTFALTVTLAVI